MYIMFKWIMWLDEQKENSNAFSYSYDMMGAKHHVDDCYLYCVGVTGFSANNKHKIVYSHLNSSWWEFTSSRASREWTGILRQMEFEDNSSPETIQHSSNDPYVPEERT